MEYISLKIEVVFRIRPTLDFSAFNPCLSDT